jgi:hypothetical protein
LLLQRQAGNRAVQRLVDPEYRLDDLRVRVSNATGVDVTDVPVRVRSPEVPSPMLGVARGGEVALRGGLDTVDERHVAAHELAHVALGEPSATSRAERERDADAAGRRALAQTSERTSWSARPSATALRTPHYFDPRFHRASVVNALAGPSGGGFTAEEIGMIYQANWERDLSQVHPALANVISSWKRVKLAAAEPATPGPDRERAVTAAEQDFMGVCAALLDQVQATGVEGFKNTRSFGGYAFWEHMDNPGDSTNELVQFVEQRRVELTIPADVTHPHLFISREYIKQMLVDAVALVFPDTPLTGAAADAAAASRARLAVIRPEADRLEGSSIAPGGDAAPVAAETTAHVRTAHPDTSTAPSGAPPAAFERLGRASHALEDFWSHSNFIEMAIGEARFNNDLADLERNEGLTTATFGQTDASHAIAHKVRGLADEIDAELPLLRHLSGRGALPSPADVRAGDLALPAHESEHDETGRFGHLYRAARQRGPFEALAQDPALAGAVTGGAVTGGLRAWLGADDPRNNALLRTLGGGLAGGLGALGGLIGGAVVGAGTGWLEGGSAAGHAVDGDGPATWAGALAAGAGSAIGFVTGAVSGAVGGTLGSYSEHDDGSGVAAGALSGARLFGDGAVSGLALELLVSRDGVALLRSVAERMERETRDEIAEATPGAPAAGSHSLLAKDQAGHDDDAFDQLRTAKFHLAQALSVAADRMIIGEMRAALTAPNASVASTRVDAIATRLDELTSAPTEAHPLWHIIAEHRARIEDALTAHYRTAATAAVGAGTVTDAGVPGGVPDER